MILSNFRTLIRAYVPSAKIAVISNTLLDLLINKAVEEVNVMGAIWKSDTTFNVVADLRDYEIPSVITDFVCFDETGLWWNDGTSDSPDWKRLTAMTRQSLDTQYPRWRDEDSDSPLRYILEGTTITVLPIPDTALDNGFWAFYIKKPVTMTAGTHYPFSGTTTEYTQFTVLDDAIIDYVRWKLARPLGQEQKGVLSEQDFVKNLAARITLFKRRLDVTGNNARMRTPTIG